MFYLESPHRGDLNEYTQHTIFNVKQKTTQKFPKSEPEAMRFFVKGTQEQVRNSRGKRAISVHSLKFYCTCMFFDVRGYFEI